MSRRGEKTAFVINVMSRVLSDVVDQPVAASPRVTRESAKRWTLGAWWLAVFVMASGFTGHMKASLTMKDEGGRMDTVHDIVLRPNVVPVIIRGTTFVELFSVRSPFLQQSSPG